MTEITILIVVLVLAVLIGLLIRRREGRARPAAPASTNPERAGLLAAAGVTGTGPAVLHFSAEWCGPCAAVRRVVAGVTADLAAEPHPPQDIEIDIDAEPALARELNVLSLPTTFVFDAAGRERFRISGVPKAGDLRSALAPLTAADQG
ncbi:thioredoxin family protein [Nocardia farcinica]|uniref:Thioredoxin n=3 Tax=Nocardia TaxID=1817 RepID=A0A0H5PBN2_NOCFR|nr:thioredoxin family protein [Nocardia farcinica]AXK86661.1 thioredoxin [Nocardia farcinica]MBA4857032.1 thioredoxin family protein [Nocardia farcinica]MBC9817109.1 thioredoxin family protein [Nocardia farcinica]MBF6070552.1 thioredoxin family protein [Nocardia farcinica]MBF6138793.1 thioredoxin family protein [Nocardia farcinica]